MLIFQESGTVYPAARKPKRDAGITELAKYSEKDINTLGKFLYKNQSYVYDLIGDESAGYFMIFRKKADSKIDIKGEMQNRMIFENSNDPAINRFIIEAKTNIGSKIKNAGEGAAEIVVTVSVTREKKRAKKNDENDWIGEKLENGLGEKEKSGFLKGKKTGIEFKVNIVFETMNFERLDEYANKNPGDWESLRDELKNATDEHDELLSNSSIFPKEKISALVNAKNQSEFLSALDEMAKWAKGEKSGEENIYFPQHAEKRKSNEAVERLYDNIRYLKLDMKKGEKEENTIEDSYAKLDGKPVEVWLPEEKKSESGVFYANGGMLYILVEGEQKDINSYLKKYGEVAEIRLRGQNKFELKMVKTDEEKVLPGFNAKTEKIVFIGAYDISSYVNDVLMPGFIDWAEKKNNEVVSVSKGSYITFQKISDEKDNRLNYEEYYRDIANSIIRYASGKNAVMPKVVKAGYLLVFGDMACTDTNFEISPSKGGDIHDTRMVSEETISLMRTAIKELWEKKRMKLKLYYFAVAPEKYDKAISKAKYGDYELDDSSKLYNVDVSRHFGQLKRLYGLDDAKIVEIKFKVGGEEYSVARCEGDEGCIIWMKGINIDTPQKLEKMKEYYEGMLAKMKQPKQNKK